MVRPLLTVTDLGEKSINTNSLSLGILYYTWGCHD